MTTSVYEEQEAEGGNFLAHIPSILWQRKWLLILPIVIGVLAGIAACFILPTTYSSKSVILVQSAQLPGEVAGEGTNEVVDRRIARIRQQVLSRPGLIALVNKHQLYPTERAAGSLSKIVEDMRNAIAITPMTADVQQTGAGKSATIAFSLSYDYSDPVKAQSVAQELTEQILRLDSSVNSEQAATTQQFLTDQAAGLQAQIAELENAIATIKAQNGRVLANGGGLTMIGSGGSYDIQIAALQRENSQLVNQRQTAQSSSERDPVISAAEAQLAAARAVYSDDHPDVVFARQRLREAQALAKQNVAKIPLESIDQQIAFNNSQIAQLRAASARERSEVSSSISAQSRAPLVLQQIAQYQQRLDGLNEQYQAVSGRLLAAQAGVKAESEMMGERLSVIDPPVIPDKPVSPDWLLLVGGGLGGGLGLGFVLVFALELFMQPIRDPNTITGLLGEPPMIMIPTLVVPGTSTRKFRLWPFGRTNPGG